MSFSSTGLQATCSRDISPRPLTAHQHHLIFRKNWTSMCASSPSPCQPAPRFPRAERKDTGVILPSTQYAISLELSDTHHVAIPSSNINLPQLVAHICRGSRYLERQRIQWQATEHPRSKAVGGIRGTVSQGGEGLMIE